MVSGKMVTWEKIPEKMVSWKKGPREKNGILEILFSS